MFSLFLSNFFYMFLMTIFLFFAILFLCQFCSVFLVSVSPWQRSPSLSSYTFTLLLHFQILFANKSFLFFILIHLNYSYSNNYSQSRILNNRKWSTIPLKHEILVKKEISFTNLVFTTKSTGGSLARCRTGVRNTRSKMNIRSRNQLWRTRGSPISEGFHMDRRCTVVLSLPNNAS